MRSADWASLRPQPFGRGALQRARCLYLAGALRALQRWRCPKAAAARALAVAAAAVAPLAGVAASAAAPRAPVIGIVALALRRHCPVHPVAPGEALGRGSGLKRLERSDQFHLELPLLIEAKHTVQVPVEEEWVFYMYPAGPSARQLHKFSLGTVRPPPQTDGDHLRTPLELHNIEVEEAADKPSQRLRTVPTSTWHFVRWFVPASASLWRQTRHPQGPVNLQEVDHHERQRIRGEVPVGSTANALLLGPELDGHAQVVHGRVEARVVGQQPRVWQGLRVLGREVHVQLAGEPELQDGHLGRPDLLNDLESRRRQMPLQALQGPPLRVLCLVCCCALLEAYSVEVRAPRGKAVREASKRLHTPPGPEGPHHDLSQLLETPLSQLALLLPQSDGTEAGLHVRTQARSVHRSLEQMPWRARQRQYFVLHCISCAALAASAVRWRPALLACEALLLELLVAAAAVEQRQADGLALPSSLPAQGQLQILEEGDHRRGGREHCSTGNCCQRLSARP
mmetsp:Transcript_101418/g.295501  ORF Transcript_101418/g.295501 Transcript_101418/m.295501 type:complete len:511 (+) Transcript_101418:95-1627(+)